ncbi:MAG: EAL domain-containing protein [Alphaproteobacteria bacterium]|nr:EAL domain-containing protein [Alphaproteobacteria bacterium]MBU1551014.1 EAL domain-containing protein [Alphaproteobacteria bacterium]MBU2339150.1 EAL domain-containing protein [Alphaproteobacteria bacterium]MBU2387241.1 EAL domain-containing protein [Alphaproteobacteria bacterium]
MADIRLEDTDTIAAEVRTAQAVSVVSALTISLVANCFIALTTVAILWIHTPYADALYWLAAVFALNAVRLGVLAGLQHYDAARRHSRLTLRILTGFAFISGCLWAVIPFLDASRDSYAAKAYVIFIIAGICAGSVIQSPAFSKVATAFGAPQMATGIVSLLMAGSLIEVIVAFDLALLMVMMFRSCRTSEANFISSHSDRLRAVSLADSLSKANAAIQTSNRQLELLANRDPLTGLGNRSAFNLGLSQHLDECSAKGQPAALLIIDLDRFKSVNDTMGHAVGDVVLSAFASRLSTVIAPGDLAVRLGGDEFAILVHGTDARTRAERIAAEILVFSARPVMVGDRPVVTGASIGLALLPEHATSAEDLFAFADIALYAAKEEGRRRICVFNPQIKQRLDRQKQIEIALEAAIEAGDIRVYFQPQVDLNDGSVIGCEALIRWTHPELGAVRPPEIVVAAKTIHASEKLTRHVATAAAALVRRLPALGLPDLRVAINVSPNEFSAYSVSRMLEEVVEAAGIRPAQLEVEITEEATLDQATAGVELARLEEAGFGLAVDDFGVGHSSLAYLIGLKVDRLKIDRSFVNGIAGSRQNQALVAALIGMGRALSMDIVVEGVETAADAEVLRMLGCRFAQGYLYGQPMPVETLESWISLYRPSPSFAASPLLSA